MSESKIHVIRAEWSLDEGMYLLEKMLQDIDPYDIVIDCSEKDAAKAYDEHNKAESAMLFDIDISEYPEESITRKDASVKRAVREMQLCKQYAIWVPMKYASEHPWTRLHHIDINGNPKAQREADKIEDSVAREMLSLNIEFDRNKDNIEGLFDYIEDALTPLNQLSLGEITAKIDMLKGSPQNSAFVLSEKHLRKLYAGIKGILSDYDIEYHEII